MGLKEKPAPPPAAQATDVEVTLHRCPYCHDDVGRVASVACQGCLARHHDACWDESGHCGSCGDTTALRAPTKLTPEVAVETLVAQGFARDEAQSLFAPKPRRWTTHGKVGAGVGLVFFVSGFGLGIEILVKLLVGAADPPLFMIGPALLAVAIGLFLQWLSYPEPEA